jgi:hypothetical protein
MIIAVQQRRVQTMETINRDLAVEEITNLLLGTLVGLEQDEKRASDPNEDAEKWALQMEKDDERILTLMQVAQKLGVYDDTAGGVAIPQRLLDAYWGPDHPNAQRG